ncbi:BofC C-terminal domain-containing protein [Anaerocolumna xylanovorans]|uniref:BofC C-terminal domain-containing protein n=1 Tax=Anaerocolumna xylanovorans DSM 12503 TaxID=1121345 RepID=A0A1M7YC39_9FIRM|nr:BofC C-terminal domain-containing protein [Anaerocolumna xylanovorans]SHO50204.1 BofC C-terminal domain-containing protein [Anaerocolumna xylanovorans DSM 12503]
MRYKKAVTYFLGFLSIACIFTACYYFSYKQALKEFNENAVERNNDLIKELKEQGYLNNTANAAEAKTTGDNGSTGKEEGSEAGDTAASAVTNAVLPTTQYTLQTYDMKTGSLKEEELPTPSYLIGLNREEVMQYLKEYLADLSLSEFEKGLVSFELISFSKDNIVLRKTYNSDSVEYKYFLKAVDGYIVAYYGDQKTVYNYTGVSVENLALEDRLQLEKGIFVKDLDELYAILENYSS